MNTAIIKTIKPFQIALTFRANFSESDPLPIVHVNFLHFILKRILFMYTLNIGHSITRIFHRALIDFKVIEILRRMTFREFHLSRLLRRASFPLISCTLFYYTYIILFNVQYAMLYLFKKKKTPSVCIYYISTLLCEKKCRIQNIVYSVYDTFYFEYVINIIMAIMESFV